MSWLAIQYREFYDIPRAFVVERRAEWYFFDCPFDPETDDYPDYFAVYRLPRQLGDRFEAMSWEALAEIGDLVGRVPASAVEFDQSKRRCINDRVVEVLPLPPPGNRGEEAITEAGRLR